jgi:polyhydroxyalkanoate synthesis regulator phasin
MYNSFKSRQNRKNWEMANIFYKKGGVMLNKRLFLVFICVFLSLALIVIGCRRYATTEDKVKRITHYLTDDMSLTAEQEGILQNFTSDLTERIKKVKISHKELRNELIEQIRSDVMDQDKVKEEVSFVRSEIDETITFAISGIAEFHQTFTKDQKERLIEKIEGLRKLHGCD